ncbi:MAG: hypothetical protein KAU36_03610 [candidate division Zixibacteria bacterium]|nr:hypothetical protein [candidate division Zixibacteria bacterium]
MPSSDRNAFFVTAGDKVTEIKVAEQSGDFAVLSFDYTTPSDSGARRPQIIVPLLQFVNKAAVKLKQLDIPIVEFSFSPNGRQLAFITGKQITDQKQFVPLRFGIYDRDTDSVNWLIDFPDTRRTSRGVYWAANGYIYLNGDDMEIVRIKGPDFAAESTGVHGKVNVSPDGRFNLLNAGRRDKGDLIEVIDLTTGENISPWLYRLLGETLDRVDYGTALYARWLGYESSFLGINLGNRALVVDLIVRTILLEEYGTLRFDPDRLVGARSLWLVKRGKQLTTLDIDRTQ